MHVGENNRVAMQRWFPELYERIRGLSYDSCDDERIEIIEEKKSRFGDVSAVLLHMSDGGLVRLNSDYNPEHEAKVWMDGQENPNASYYLIFGLGNGVFAREIIRHIGPDKPVLIYEPSARLFLWTMERYDLSEFFCSRAHVIVEGINEDLFMAVMETILTFETYRDYQIYLTPRMATAFPNSREMFVRHLAADGIGWMEGNIATERKELYISPYNLLHNLRYLDENTVVPRLRKSMEKDVPVLLVGAAPSLAGEIETIRQYRNRVYIFAADTACSFLMEHDIIPDAFMSVEADKPLSYYRDERLRDVPLFGKMNTSHKLMAWHRAIKIFGYDDNSFIHDYYKQHHIPESEYRYGGNTMTALFAICDEIGMETVILVGQDMCFDNEGNTHVDDNRSDSIEESGDFYCVNNQGETVKTRYDWFTFLRWYESAIFDCGMKHIINVSSKGAMIKGTEVMTLADAIREYGKDRDSFGSILKNTEGAFPSGEKQNLQREYQEWEKDLEEIRAKTQLNPRDETRKTKSIYGLLRKYEMVDEEGNFELSQAKGIDTLINDIREMAE